MTTISKTTMKTITMKRSILRCSPETPLFADFVVGAGDGACVIGVSCTRVGDEVCRNGLGGTCGEAGEKILSCVEEFD